MRFIREEELIYGSKSISEDYHVNISSIKYKNRFEEKRIPNMLFSCRSTV
jgi:hypothetical protein